MTSYGKPFRWMTAAVLLGAVAFSPVPAALVVSAVLLSVVAVSVAAAETWDTVRFRRIEADRRERETEAITSSARLLQAMAQLSPAAQLELAAQLPNLGFTFETLLIMRGGDPYFLPALIESTVPTGRIPGSFVKAFLEMSNRRNLCPVSRWSKGTQNRQYADALTRRFVYSGFAEWNKDSAGHWIGGNQSARWVVDRSGISYYDRVCAAWWVFLPDADPPTGNNVIGETA